MLAFTVAILKLQQSVPGCIVECGSFKGGGTAKLSIVAKLADRELYVFDSFKGIPENSEAHAKNIWGGQVSFRRGDYCGSIEEVRANVTKLGEVAPCRFVKGVFSDTLPPFQEQVAAAYIDVDLVSSTKTCLKYLWPLLAPGGVLFSQDGHLPLVIDLLSEKRFWNSELGSPIPVIHGLGTKKLVWMRKSDATHSL